MSYVVSALDDTRPQLGDGTDQLPEEIRAIKSELIVRKAAQEADAAAIAAMGDIISRNLTIGTADPDNGDGADGDIYLQYVV